MTADPRPTLFLLCGKIASGKSTMARQLAERPGRVLICQDDWMSELFIDRIKTIEDYRQFSARLRAAMGPHVVDLLQHGLSVVLDFPANTVINRDWMRDLFTRAGAAHELHVLDVPDAVCKSRLQQRNADGTHAFKVSELVFDGFGRYHVPPADAEGFNLVRHPHRTGP